MDKAQKLLDFILECVSDASDKGLSTDRVLRASLSGKQSRYLAFYLGGYQGKPLDPRTTITFETGDAVHDIIRKHLEESGAKITNVEEEVKIPFFDNVEVTGHIDLLLEYEDTPYLLDIKTLDHRSYAYLDPKNTKNSLYAAARHFTFDPMEWLFDPFKSQYVYQLATYWNAADAANLIDVDTCIPGFLAVNKSTGHIALGLFDDLKVWFDTAEELLENRDFEWGQALKKKDPYSHPVCVFEGDRNSPKATPGHIAPVACQYCSFVEHCLETTTSFEHGRPVIKVVNIRKEPINE